MITRTARPNTECYVSPWWPAGVSSYDEDTCNNLERLASEGMKTLVRKHGTKFAWALSRGTTRSTSCGEYD
jgi:hypothetical protein